MGHAAHIGHSDVMALGCLCFALPIGAGDLWPYVTICITTGFAIGADLVILPSLFTAHLARNHLPSTQAFGLWNFATKLALVGAALIALPVLDFVGFQSGGTNSAQALSTLSWIYAGVPAALKLLALFWVLRLPSDLFDGQPQETLT